MAISFNSLSKRNNPRNEILQKVLMRTVKLAFLGLMTSNFGKPFNDLRIPGVLMRFAVSYFVVSMIIIFVPKINRPDGSENKIFVKYQVLYRHFYEIIAAFLIVGLWLGLTFGLPVPGCPTGYLGPGGIGDFGSYPNCTGGAAGYIDRQILGLTHLYQEPTCQPIYLTGAYDPEGLLGCLTSITMVFIGLMAGRVVVYHKEHKERLVRWLSGSVFFGIISLILTEGTQNGGVIILNILIDI